MTNENEGSRKIIGIGETILDIIFKDNKVICAVPGGSTFNTIVSLGRCNANAVLMSETGNDYAGDYVFSFLKENGVDTNCMLRVNGTQTPVSLAFLNERNDAAYSFYRNGGTALPDMLCPEVKEGDIVLFGSYYAIEEKGSGRVREFLRYAKSKGAILYYDVNFRPAHKEKLAKLKPNIIKNLELADIVRGSREDFDIIYGLQDARKLYRSELSFYTDTFIYTDGERPVSVFSRNFCKEYPVGKCNVVSTIGAGDSFNAGFIYALSANGITRNDLGKGLAESVWDSLVSMAQRFAADCCGSIFNYITKEFAAQL